MNTRFSEEDEKFRRETVEWLSDHLVGEFAVIKGRGGPGVYDNDDYDVTFSNTKSGIHY